jgi:microcystin degradation protein MlrC
MLEMLARADSMKAEHAGVLDISVNAGFPWADIAIAGPSVTVVCDRRIAARGHAELAQQLMQQMCNRAGAKLSRRCLSLRACRR